MTLENVELVPAECPECGAKLQIPGNLTKAHCIYCGMEFIISEKKPDTHYHMGERVGTIENYVKIAISSIKSGDMAKAKEYLNKAKEINLERADKEIDKKSEEIARSYLTLSIVKSKEIYNAPIYEDYYYSDNLDVIKIYEQESNIAWQNGISFIKPENKALLSDAWVTAAIIKIPQKDGPFKYFPKMINAINEDSKICLRKALEYNPQNEDAIRMLKELGAHCSTCKGNGKCPSCGGSGFCHTCNGKGLCPKCGGSGKISGLLGKEKSCKICSGSGKCKSCKGTKECSKCLGEKICPTCHGRGL